MTALCVPAAPALAQTGKVSPTPEAGTPTLAPGPAGGSLILNSAGTAGLYRRSRGHGADDMLLTSAGLWIASDNFGGGTSCGGKSGFSGLCLLPYPS